MTPSACAASASNTTASVVADRRAKPRIAHVITESTPFGGAQRNTLLSLAGLTRDGYHAELVCGPGGRLIDEARAICVRVHVANDLVRAVNPLRDARALITLYRLFRAAHYDLVHTHSTKAGLLGRLAAWCAAVPVVVHTVHGYPFEMRAGLKARVYSAVERGVSTVTDRLVCVGEVLREEVSRWRMAPVSKLVTVHSGIDFAAYRPRRPRAETRRLLGIEDAWPVVGSIGHLVDAKAHHYLIEAAALLASTYPRLRLLIVGEGPRRAALERQIAALDLGRHVTLVGERDDVADVLDVLDVYAMSSCREGVGRALTEAMYWGLPIVATAVNGVTELVRHEETGLLVPPHDSRRLAAALHRLVVDAALAQRLGTQARLTARTLMGADRMIAELERLYDELLAARAAEAEKVPWYVHLAG